MAEITLKKAVKTSVAPFVVHLENEETGQTETYRYTVKRLGNKAAMRASLLMADFARDKNRNELMGSSVIADVLKGTVPVHEKDESGNITKATPEFMDLLDFFDDDGFKSVIELLVKTAKTSSVSEG